MRSRPPDDVGFDVRDLHVFTRGLSALVPPSLARRAVAISVRTDRSTYACSDPVELEIVIRNRLPLPIDVPTTEQRLFGWRFDGLLEASEECVFRAPSPNELSLRARERRTIERVWDGSIRREGDRTHWEPVEPGTYEIEAFLTTDPETTDATTVTFEQS
ncbi:hypothetical protein [Halovivax cerinus]|uniref:DUF7974 domain-containing protein n=1 Tax=Halovivax cerinus TaxID=1487865 RepID=A0ABD5NL91_9EURY|nr:hypothetical protein [Halovivax cerinus]